jgi:hypothetical protein
MRSVSYQRKVDDYFFTGDDSQSRETIKIWSRVTRDQEPKMTVLARTSSNLAVSHFVPELVVHV